MKRALHLTIIFVLTAALLWWFLESANLGEVWEILRTTSLMWIALGMAVNLTTLLFRTIRWRLLLDPDDPPPVYATFFANTVGYMLSSVLPIRAADVARPALLARRSSQRFSGALGSVLAERILDMSAILLLFLYFAARRWNEYTSRPETRDLWMYLIRPTAMISIGILAAVAVFIVGVLYFRSALRRFHERMSHVLPQRFRSSWMNFFDAFVQSLEITRDRAAFAKVLACTVGVWTCLSGQFVLTTIAMRHPLPIDASFFITGATTLGTAVPTPGGIGGMHKVAQFILMRFYDFDTDLAVAAAVLFHIVGTLPVVVLGVALFAREGLRWKEVTRA